MTPARRSFDDETGLTTTGAGGRAAEKQSPPIREGEIPSDTLVGPILRQIAFNHELRSNGKAVLGQAEPDQLVGTAAFDQPAGDRAIRVFHIEVEPRMGIDHFPFR